MEINNLIAYGIGLLLVYLIVRMLVVPLRYLWIVLYNGILGGLILWGLNFVGAYFGFHLALNPLTALLVGFLGVPGLALLIAFKYLT